MVDRLAVVVFEGGRTASEVERELARVRQAVTLDNLALARQVSQVDRVILVTDRADLAAKAQELGVTVYRTDDGTPFHFGEVLRRVISNFELDHVIYFGGAALPLLRADDLLEWAERLRSGCPQVLVNNPLSADVIAFSPAGAVERLHPLPTEDNFLGHLFREQGLERVLMPNSARINFDLDTPTDLLLLDSCRRVGTRTRAALNTLHLPRQPLQRALRVMTEDRTPYPEVALIGRVGPVIMSIINANLKVRLRVYSEERGMKALQREERDEVRSWLGFFLEAVGPEAFIATLAKTVDVAFIDTRVLFAHLHLHPTPHDRYSSDLGRVDAIGDATVRAFTRAAQEAVIPIILGGHSLIYGGLWAVLEENGCLHQPVPRLPGA